MLTKSEEQIMELLWSEGEPLTSSEIIKKSIDKTWKDSYVHLLINSLMDKGIIKVDGFKKATKNYARTFSPTMTREEYLVFSITKSKSYNGVAMSRLFTAFVSQTTDVQLIHELEKVIAERKKELAAAD